MSWSTAEIMSVPVILETLLNMCFVWQLMAGWVCDVPWRIKGRKMHWFFHHVKNQGVGRGVSGNLEHHLRTLNPWYLLLAIREPVSFMRPSITEQMVMAVWCKVQLLKCFSVHISQIMA